MISINTNGRAVKRPARIGRDQQPALDRTVARRMRFAASKDWMALWVRATPHPWQASAYRICLEREVAYDDLSIAGKVDPAVSDCRHAVMHALNKQHGMSLPTIGHYLGCDHATVLRGIRRHEAQLPFTKETECKG